MAKSKPSSSRVKATAHRTIELPKRRWYNPRTWRRNLPLPPRKKLSSVRQLVKASFILLKTEWRTFAGISIIYGFGVLVFVRSFSVNSTAIESVASKSGFFGKIGGTVSQIANLLSDANISLSTASSVYQIIISTICCLALIWVFRRILSQEKVSVKQSFYQGMSPLIKYLLVLAMLGVHLLPVAIGAYIFSIIINSGVYTTLELWVTLIAFLTLALWTLWLVTHSIFALFITTLPDMTPLRALRSAKKMVYRRRMIIWRKLLGAIVLAALVVVIVMLPFVLWWTAAAPWMVYVLSVTALPTSQAYLYTIYREIL